MIPWDIFTLPIVLLVGDGYKFATHERHVSKGDIMVVKQSGGALVAVFELAAVWFLQIGDQGDLAKSGRSMAKRYHLLAMEAANVRNMMRILGGDPVGKVGRLLDRDIADPWYTGDFEATWRDLQAGCQALLQRLAP